jgi:F-type H+-transporting ATPase subunit c
MKLIRTIGLTLGTVMLTAGPALAQETASGGFDKGLTGLGATLGLGLAALGAGLGQGKATASAMESIGRNPNSTDRIFTPLLLGLALMEALALYPFVIAFLKVQ